MIHRAQNASQLLAFPGPQKKTHPPTSPFVRLFYFFTYPPIHRVCCTFDPRRLSLFPAPGL
jgi:hypothetical protein